MFEDDDIIVIEKAAGLLIIATDDNTQTIAYRQLMDRIEDQLDLAILTLQHPVTAEPMRFQTDMPAKFLSLFSKEEMKA
ncbi:hypothetical protein ACFO4N_11625 [Camelliibacillus cellulosilyticus]|uniref:RNA pseudouridylate synthase n=1 Tax=Camelliibacillus cellulosilyticus TaxID=2174486 RepID=A0ABV9GN45_9BACL